MKKLLFFVLIVALFCFSIEENNVDDDDVLLELSLKKIWRGLKKSFKKTVNFLKKAGIYDLIVKQLKKSGKKAAVDVCKEKFDESSCNDMIDIIDKNIK